ncbi:hypothetical protein QBC44DRAFT_146659 [Cladorrhinum sp. PSN332]|nr:hypothetical protein QBC44DRAFT_146659 [Cladorrhinum sp. PSN332]
MAHPLPPIPPNKGDASRSQLITNKQPSLLSKIYSWISTPLLLLSFILSLIFIDLRNSARRAHFHADHHHSSHGGSSASSSSMRMPGWLHRIIYRYRPYRYVVVVDDDDDDDGKGGDKKKLVEKKEKVMTTEGKGEQDEGEGEENFYHSHQKKLAKMEIAEAFEMRGVVMVVLGLLTAVLGWGVWKGTSLVWRVVVGVLVAGRG